MARYKRTIMALLRSEFSLLRKNSYIGGKWITGESTFPVYNPATGEEIAQVADMGDNEAEQAVTEAYNAFTKWKNTSAKVLLNVIKITRLLIVN